jgi:hypothetical protein
MATPRRRAEDAPTHLRIVKPNETRVKVSNDAFAAAVAMAMRDQHETDLLDASAVLHRRTLLPTMAKFALAIAAAAAAALAYVLLSSPSQSPSERQRSTLSGASNPATPRRAPALLVRNHSATVNEPLELGVGVDPVEPGATVAITGMPLGAMLTGGEQISLTEWAVPAGDAASVLVVPPRDFVGDITPSAELRSPDGTAIARSALKLSWKAPTTAPMAVPPARPQR